MKERKFESFRNRVTAVLKTTSGLLKFCIIALSLALLWVLVGEWLIVLAGPPFGPNEGLIGGVIYYFWPFTIGLVVMAVMADTRVGNGYAVRSGWFEGINLGSLSAISVLYVLLPIIFNGLSRLFRLIGLKIIAEFFSSGGGTARYLC